MEKGSDELFAIDTAGSKQILKSYNRLHKPLKSDEILAQRSAVPAVDNRKRSGITDGLIEPQEKRRKGNGVHPQEFNRLRIIARGGGIPHKDIVEVDGAPSYDPWSATTVNASQDSHYNYLDKPRPIKPPKTLKEAPNSLVEGVPHFPAVPKPQAGKSYNPMFEDWDRLLVEEGKKELDAERKRLKEAEEERTRLERIANAQEEKDGVQTEDESAWEGFESGYDGEDHLKRRRPERKTQAQRNKAKRRKEAESQAKQEADLKRRTRQAQRIREIAQEVNNQKLANAGSLVAANNSRLSADKYAALRRRKLGKSTYVQSISPERCFNLWFLQNPRTATGACTARGTSRFLTASQA